MYCRSIHNRSTVATLLSLLISVETLAGLYKVAFESSSGNSGDSGSCNFDGSSNTWSITKIDNQTDAINWTFVEDREVQSCGEAVRRYTRVESIIYKVRSPSYIAFILM